MSETATTQAGWVGEWKTGIPVRILKDKKRVLLTVDLMPGKKFYQVFVEGRGAYSGFNAPLARAHWKFQVAQAELWELEGQA